MWGEMTALENYKKWVQGNSVKTGLLPSTERKPRRSVYIFLADHPKTDFRSFLGPLLKCPLFKKLENAFSALYIVKRRTQKEIKHNNK